MYLNIKTNAHLLGSTIKTEDLTQFLKEQMVEGCAITNGQFYQLPDFQEQMQRAGLKAVYGLEVQLASQYTQPQPILLYAMNKAGFDNLVKITSAAMNQSNEQFPLKWLKAYKENLLAIVPALSGTWAQENSLLAELKVIFEKNILLGVTRTCGQVHVNESRIIELAVEHQMPLVALHESYYLTQDDAFAYETLQAIKYGEPHDSLIAKNTNYYVPTKVELQQWFADKPQWLATAAAIISQCTVIFDEYEAHMPKYPLENNDSEATLERLALYGLKVRLFGNWQVNDEIPPLYLDRLQYELNVINKMGYADYFMIVADYMAFAKREGILTGPGRGSSASSLVAYALQITQIDPLQYGLLFERFLNPERISLPDIDIDFIDTRRFEVIRYVKEKYGKDFVAQIGTFGNLTKKSAGRDVGRMLKFTDKELKQVSTMLDKSRKDMLIDVYNDSKDLQAFVNESERNQVWFKTALKIEGSPRNVSTHAAGVIFTPQSLVNYVPLQKASDDIYLTQWTMLEVEAKGVLKMDFLGLKNLSTIEDVCKSLEAMYGVKPTLETIPMDDAKTFELLQKGYVEGVFQLESDGMRQSLMSVEPTEFSDIIAINALYRPGPMEFIKNYAARKLGQEQVEYPHEILKPILEETKGIIIFQEQILLIAQKFAGFSIAEADLLRRAISKKKRDVLEQQERLFVQGAVQQGHSQQLAQDIYALIVKFAEYGFPKSHSTAYSVITYQMAYLKANYPSHFYATLLNNAAGNVTKMKRILEEMKNRNIQLLPIEIGKSAYETRAENKAIRLGYQHIKGITQTKLAPFLIEPKEDFFSYCKEVGQGMDKETALRLIKAGAFDKMKDRATLAASIDEAVSHAKTDEYFDFGFTPSYQEPDASFILREVEMDVFGFTLQAHPIVQARPKDVTNTFETLKKGTAVKVVGLVEAIKVIKTKKSEDMAFVTCSDETGNLSITVFPRLYKEVSIALGNIILIEGKVEVKNGKNSMIADKIVRI